MPKTPSDRIALRGDVFYYVRRVPKRFVEADPRGIVFISLRTADRRRAEEAAIIVERELERAWATIASGASPDAWTRYHAAVERARLEGFVYRSAAEIAHEDHRSLTDRLLAMEAREHDRSAAAAIIGIAEKPEIKLTEARKLFFEYSASEMIGKRPDQVRRWENPRNLAVDEFVKCIGEDKPLSALTRDDARSFQAMWLERIRDGGYGRNSMNKQVSHLARMLHVVSEELKLGLPSIFTGLGVSEMKGTRPPYDRAFVEGSILKPGALAGMNLDARIALLVCAETGMGAEEVTSLRAGMIHLDAPIPFVSVVSREGAMQKNAEYRPRDLPLVGVALMAMKLRPNGIERYHDKNASLSAVVNKFLGENGLKPTPRHCLYSFRHSFQDRLTEAEAPDRLQAELMGHKYIREKYGKGPGLAQKQRWLERIAYRPPEGWEV